MAVEVEAAVRVGDDVRIALAVAVGVAVAVDLKKKYAPAAEAEPIKANRQQATIMAGPITPQRRTGDESGAACTVGDLGGGACVAVLEPESVSGMAV